MNYDWSKFSQRIRIKATVQEVYDAWTSRAALESWFLRMAEFSRGNNIIPDEERIQQGDTYLWRWHGYPDSINETGEILEVNGQNRLRFTFGKAGIVTVDIAGIANGESEMTITQTDIPTDEQGKQDYHVGCATGWTFYRCNLKSILEGGIDLRNKGNNNDMND